jgi:aminocarboxymuconate-semialdehyde decarboxylase
MSRVIDIHTTFYPDSWLEYLQTRQKSPMAKRNGDTLALSIAGTTLAYVNHTGFYDPVTRLKNMDQAGVDAQILALSIPSVELLEPEEGIIWSRNINNALAEVCWRHPGRFYFHATLPYQSPEAAVIELERAYRELGAKGVMLFSNINGKSVALPEFYPIYAKAAEYGLPINIHPTLPLTQPVMDQYNLPSSLYGFLLDTTMAVTALIWQGVLEQFPELVLVHSHLGGLFPYTVGRMERNWNSFSNRKGLHLKKRPSEYYRSQVYVDSISQFAPAMKACLEFMGPDHICFGTDYAHIGSLSDARKWIDAFGLSQEGRDMILGGNAARIYNLE